MKAEYDVLNKLHQHVDHFDQNYADAPAGNGQAPAMVHQKGNPSGATAQFALLNIQKAFTVSTGTFTAINLDTAQAAGFVNSALFFFGNTDFQAGYSKAKTLVPLTVGTYGTPFIVGRDPYPVANVNGVLTVLSTAALNVLQNGDVVVPITARVTGTDYVILSIHRCAQVPYSSLLQSNISNSFNQKGIRYILQDETTQVLTQYTQPLYNFAASWLGQFKSDSTDIDSNNQPGDFRKNIVDVALTMGITKASGLCSLVTMPSSGSIATLTIKFSTWASNVVNPQL